MICSVAAQSKQLQYNCEFNLKLVVDQGLFIYKQMIGIMQLSIISSSIVTWKPYLLWNLKMVSTKASEHQFFYARKICTRDVDSE